MVYFCTTVDLWKTLADGFLFSWGPLKTSLSLSHIELEKTSSLLFHKQLLRLLLKLAGADMMLMLMLNSHIDKSRTLILPSSMSYLQAAP